MGRQEQNLRLVKWLTIVSFFIGLMFTSWWLYEGAGYFRDEMATQDNYGPRHGPRLALPDGTVPYFGAGYDWREIHLRPRPQLKINLALGEKLYNDNCVFCHAADGRGDAPVGMEYDPAPPDLRAALRQTPRQLFRAISDGMSSAPAIDSEPDPGPDWHAYRLYLSENQRRQILAYLESRFGPGAKPAAISAATTIRRPCHDIAGNPPCPK